MKLNDTRIANRRVSRGRRNRNRYTMLHVGAKTRKSAGRGRSHRAALFVLVPTAAAAVFVLAWLGIAAAAETLFSQNPRFTLKNLEIQAGTVITPDLVREYTHLQEGTNLFAFSLRQVRQDFLSRTPNVKTMTIRRVLPDTLRIEVEERKPLARIGRRGRLAVDSEGCVFGLRPGGKPLPVVVGPRESLLPGSRVHGMALAALRVIDVCENPLLELSVQSVDATGEDYLVVSAIHGGRQVRIDLAWKQMTANSAESRRHMLQKLGRWVQTMKTEKGRRHSAFDGRSDDIIGK